MNHNEQHRKRLEKHLKTALSELQEALKATERVEALSIHRTIVLMALSWAEYALDRIEKGGTNP